MSYVNLSFRRIRSSPLFDRSELVCRRWVGKRIWLGRIRKRASPAEKFGEKTAKFHRLRELHLAGPRPLYFTQKTHAERKNQPFPTSPNGCGPRLRATSLSL